MKTIEDSDWILHKRVLRVSDVAKVLREAMPAPALGPGARETWLAIIDAAALLIPVETERSEFREVCERRDVPPPQEPPPAACKWSE